MNDQKDGLPIKHQEFTISKRRRMRGIENPKGELHLIWKENEKLFAITAMESDAELIRLIPEFIQYAKMLRDFLEGSTGKRGMIYKKVNSFLLKVDNIHSKEAKEIDVNYSVA